MPKWDGLIMNNGFKLLLAVILLASVGLVLGDPLSHQANTNYLTPSIQIDQSTAVGSLTSADNHASEEKVFVGSIKSNKYHYPDCEWAKKIKPSNQIWFSSPADAIAHGYVPCKVCNPP
jgi:hypothetical protein